MNVFTEVSEYLKAKGVALVVVSKTQPLEAIMEKYDAGHRFFGENRVQELVAKQEALPKDIQWHQIGHLQTNKVKDIASFVALIHAGDSQKLLRKIDKEAHKVNRVIDVLLQAKVAEEETKYGFLPESLVDESLLSEIAQLKNIRICGVMGMASFTADQEQLHQEMKALRKIFNHIKKTAIFGDGFEVLSMGMSGDYKIAVEEGSNMVRIGRLVF